MVEDDRKFSVDQPGRLVVYLVDDDEAVRESVATILRLNGVDVRAFATAKEFVATDLEENNACLLIDIHLPDGNGVEILAGMRGRNIGLPAIIMSGRLDVKVSRDTALLAPVVWLEKPVDGDELAQMIENMFSR